mgnify:FL=1
MACYRKWDRETVAFELRQLRRDGENLSSGDLQKQDPGLHAAAVRHFGNYSAALRAAKVDPDAVRHRRKWTRGDVVRELKRFKRRHGRLTTSALRRHDPGLYAALMREFHSISAARAALATRRRASK